MHTVKYRLVEPRLAPRKTKLEMPGWAGQPEPRRDGSHEYAWHCVPFTEGAQYGIEIFYPYANELRVSKQDGQVVLDGDFGPDPGTGVQWPPFRAFGQNYYTYQLLLDLKVADDMAVRTEPHPRFYTSAGRRRPARGPGAAANKLVADDFVRRVQGAAIGRHPCLPPGRADDADIVRAGRAAVRIGADG